jgi:hypothetical protein
VATRFDLHGRMVATIRPLLCPTLSAVACITEKLRYIYGRCQGG